MRIEERLGHRIVSRSQCSDPKTSPADIAPKATPGNKSVCRRDRSGPHLQGKYRVHFQYAQPRDEAVSALLRDQLLDYRTPNFVVVELCQSAGIKVTWQM